MSRPRVGVIAWLAAVALCGLQLAHTRFVADLSSFLPSAPTPQQRLLVEQLRDGALSRVMLIAIEGADEAARAQASRGLADAMRKDPRFAAVANGAGDGFGRERELIFAHRYALSAQVTPERFSVEGLRAAIGETVDLLASPAGLAMKALVARDPTGETLAVLEQASPAGAPSSRGGVWVSRNGARALLVARTRAAGSDTDAQEAALGALEAAFEHVTSREAGMRLAVTGPGVLSVHARAMIKHDVERLALWSVAIVAALLLWVYRSPRALALGLVPVASGALAGIAAVALGFGEVHGLTLGFGTTLIGEAVDYSIYLFVQSEGASRDAGDKWLAAFWPTVRLGVLTSIAGFSALLFAGLPGLAQLGVYSITGLAAAAAVTRFVVPVLLPRGFRIRDVSAAGARLMALGDAAARWRWSVAIVSVACVAVLAMQWKTLWDVDISSLNPIDARDRTLDMALRADMGAADARYMVIVRGATYDAALAAAERIGAALDPLVSSGALGAYDSPARMLPSVGTQRARLASLPAADVLRTRLRAAVAPLGLRADRLEPFVQDTQTARAAAPLTRAQLAGTALEAATDGMLLGDARGTWTALLSLRAHGARAIDTEAIRAAIASSGVHDATLLDVKGELDRMYEGYFRRAAQASLGGLAAILALLYAALRQARRVWRVMAPVAAGVLAAAASQVATGTSLTLLHLVGLLLVVAIGSNYALFFERVGLANREAAVRTMASLALANVTTVASFGVLAISAIPLLHAIGSTVAIGAFATLLFAAALARYPVKSKDAYAH